MRRNLAISVSAIAVLGLGFLVSIAANSVPGRGADEPLLDVAWRPGTELVTVLTWLVLIAAVLGATIMALSTREVPPPREQKRRGIMVLVLGILIFALIARYMRSIAGTLLPEASELVSQVGEEPITQSNGNSAWLLSLLVAAVIAVALTRVGLTIRSSAPPSQDPTPKTAEPPVAVAAAIPQTSRDDPRGRIFGAYRDFEESVGDAGVPRGSAETAARHAGRAEAALGLGAEDLDVLSRRHADARFGPREPSVEEALEAESASDRLRKGFPR